MPWIKCTEEAYKKCPFSKPCGDAENAIFMDGSDCDKFNQSIKPPAVDAVPVVRCRDCKYYDPENYYICCAAPKGIIAPSDDDFCSFGKRKEAPDAP